MDRAFIPEKEKGYEYAVGPSYNGVLYDRFRKCYYRFVIEGRTLAQLYDMKGSAVYLMVFDEQFNYLGEQKLLDAGNIMMSFITEKGLHIVNKKHYDEVSEDELLFDIYKLKQ